MIQSGFDFSGDAQSEPASVPVWTPAPKQTAAAYRNQLAIASQRVATLEPFLREIFSRLIARSLETVSEQLELRDPDEAFSLRGSQLSATDDVYQALFEQCALAKPRLGFIYKTRRTRSYLRTGMHIEGIGSLVMSVWFNAAKEVHGHHVSYCPQKDNFFLPSFRDNRPVHQLAYSVWGPNHSAQRISETPKVAANVSTYTFAGREYVNTGSLSQGSYYECDAWGLVPVSDWKGTCHTYQGLCSEWDKETIERGDLRGLVVIVRGHRCVLADPIVFFDPDVLGSTTHDSEDADEGLELSDDDEILFEEDLAA